MRRPLKKILPILFAVTFIGVFGSYNPSGYSLYHHLAGSPELFHPLNMLIMALMALFWIGLSVWSWKVISKILFILALALPAVLVYTLHYYDILNASSTNLIQAIALGVVAWIFAIALSKAHVARAVTGTTVTDETPDLDSGETE